MPLCDFGCGNVATHFFKYSSRWCCESFAGRCPEMRRLNSERNAATKEMRSLKIRQVKAAWTPEKRAAVGNNVKNGKAKRTVEQKYETSIKYMASRLKKLNVSIAKLSDEEIRVEFSKLQTGWFERLSIDEQISFSEARTESNIITWRDANIRERRVNGIIAWKQGLTDEEKESIAISCIKTKLIDAGNDISELTIEEVMFLFSDFQRDVTWNNLSEERRQLITEAIREFYDNETEEDKVIRTERSRRNAFRWWTEADEDSRNKRIKKMVRTALTYRDYVMPSGNIVKIQGYENHALDRLLSIGYQEEQINVGAKDGGFSIPYRWKNRKRTYFPDILIRSENKIIEVKSPYFYFSKLEQNEAKMAACIENGYQFEFWVINIIRGNVVIEIIKP